MNEFLELLSSCGLPMSEINPGSNEMALSCENALKGVELLKSQNIPILGGDIMSEMDGSLIYAYQMWGKQYISLSWYCRQNPEEAIEDCARRSHELAIEKIERAKEVADRLNQKCFVILVS